MSDPGLHDQKEIDTAHQWVDDNISAALAYATGQWKPSAQQSKTVQALQQARAEQESNPFFGKVKQIVEATSDKDGKAANQKMRDDSVDLLKSESKTAMDNGHPNKGFFDAAGEFFPNVYSKFDISSPLSSLMGGLMFAFKELIKNLALTYGGDMAAPWMKSMRSKFGKDAHPMTTEEAATELRFQNALKGLGDRWGMKDEDSTRFSESFAPQIREAAIPAAKLSASANPAITQNGADVTVTNTDSKNEKIVETFTLSGTALTVKNVTINDKALTQDQLAKLSAINLGDPGELSGANVNAASQKLKDDIIAHENAMLGNLSSPATPAGGPGSGAPSK